MELTYSLIAVILGLVMLVWGADRFVAGAAYTARKLGVSPLIIGLTLVAFGTSAPEIVVAIFASLKGNPGLAIGNALGSNIANVGLVLGVTALILPLSVHSKILKREYPILLVVTIITLILFANNYLSRLDGVILFALFAVFLIWLIYSAKKEAENDEALKQEYETELTIKMTWWMAALWLLIGLIFLPIGAEILVKGAVNIAKYFGVSDLIIGLTIVAIGTSLPEVATSIISVIKKEDDIALGNVIGSNIFNLLTVVGVAGVIYPSELPKEVLLRDGIVMLGFTLALFIVAFTWRSVGRISRFKGLLLFGAYIGYLVWLLNTL